MKEQVNHPAHYNAHPSGIEAIEVCEGVSFNLGSAIKYLWRAGLKGSAETDLRKALWYLRRLTRHPSGSASPVVNVPLGARMAAAGALAYETSGPLHHLLRSVIEDERARELIDIATGEIERHLADGES